VRKNLYAIETNSLLHLDVLTEDGDIVRSSPLSNRRLPPNNGLSHKGMRPDLRTVRDEHNVEVVVQFMIGRISRNQSTMRSCLKP